MSLVAPLPLVIVAFALLDRWLIAHGLETHLEAGRSAVWLVTLVTWPALSYGLWRLRSTGRT